MVAVEWKITLALYINVTLRSARLGHIDSSIGQARVLRGYLNLFFPLYLCNFNCNIVTLLLFSIQVGTWITILTIFFLYPIGYLDQYDFNSNMVTLLIFCIQVGTWINFLSLYFCVSLVLLFFFKIQDAFLSFKENMLLYIRY